MNGLVQFIILLVVLGFVAGLVLKYVPIAEPFRSVIIAVMVFVLCLLILNFFGIVALPSGA